MNKLAALALFLFSTSALAAPTPSGPKVVFVGDYITSAWAAQRPNPNWIFNGEPATPFSGNSGGVAAAFQANVVALHPNIVHIMVGVVDQSQSSDSLLRVITQTLLANLQTMVREARAANIQIILGLEPGGWSPENAVVAAYGAANNIPVVSYENVPMLGTNIYATGTYVPTAAGFAQMNQIANAEIATLNTPVQGGYLQNELQANYDWPAQANVNTWSPGAQIQFTPVGYYAGGVIYPQVNSNIVGATGAWTSSNPLVMYIGPTGMAWTLTPGTTIIRYTSPSGVAFSQWNMTIVEGN